MEYKNTHSGELSTKKHRRIAYLIRPIQNIPDMKACTNLTKIYNSNTVSKTSTYNTRIKKIVFVNNQHLLYT